MHIFTADCSKINVYIKTSTCEEIVHLSYLNNIYKITFFVESIFSILPNVDVMPAITSSMRPITSMQ